MSNYLIEYTMANGAIGQHYMESRNLGNVIDMADSLTEAVITAGLYSIYVQIKDTDNPLGYFWNEIL